MEFKDKLKSTTRWDNIPDSPENYRLLCSDPLCSLSCANLKNGKLAVTSVHGAARHSYMFTKADMAFTTLMFLNSLSDKELEVFVKMFNKISNEYVFNLEKI